jgi:hypothetical protein
MQNVRFIVFLFALGFVLSFKAIGETIPAYHVIPVESLGNYLKPNVKQKFGGQNPSQAELAEYLREAFAERYFFNWTRFASRFDDYNTLYSNKNKHFANAKDHMQKFADSTLWKLPFNYLNGDAVNAYALRHLARQHKMVDVAFQYFYSGKDPRYINYFVTQMHSLNVALENDNYETIKDGNGVYEAFRSGYRVLNWLQIHTMFLGEAAYTDQDQLTTIATLLQHGANLYQTNQKFNPGNHQTRGLSALAMISILLRDFEGTDIWYQHAMQLLGEHLNKEINADGFQFERSVHYHISDISNYFYVYQLAQISNLQIDTNWEAKLRSLFTTLVKITYPDKTAPVLQDDTDNPWAEFNDISEALTLGYLLFNDPEFGYFAANKVDDGIYWALQQKQLDGLKSISQKKPNYGSLEFPDTHYYVMRDGWQTNDKVLIISAGVDKEKPDHQHGDVLGIQAFAYGNVVLPNYQVQYALPDFDWFKNSMVKNVALVDNELQGKKWTSNKGGSGFGKFKQLPNPTTIIWKNTDAFDLFVGSHDGFHNVGVSYSRQVINVKNDFWIVKDNFLSNSNHEYKQVWQGHYTSENGSNLLRSTFSNAAGVDIYQLNQTDTVVSSGTRGKQWSVVSKMNQTNYSFISIIYPYRGYANRINELISEKALKGWKINMPKQLVVNTGVSISNENQVYLFETDGFNYKNGILNFTDKSDVFIELEDKQFTLCLLGDRAVEVGISGDLKMELNGKKITSNIILNPGETLTCFEK